jgi:8-oxo-dGTP pyrophosphatase MutT (NUDIX family)
VLLQEQPHPFHSCTVSHFLQLQAKRSPTLPPSTTGGGVEQQSVNLDADHVRIRMLINGSLDLVLVPEDARTGFSTNWARKEASDASTERQLQLEAKTRSSSTGNSNNSTSGEHSPPIPQYPSHGRVLTLTHSPRCPFRDMQRLAAASSETPLMSSSSSTSTNIVDISSVTSQSLQSNASTTIEHQTKAPSLKLASCVLLKDCDSDRVLLTRRPAHSSLFPHVWVVPGGHSAADETPIETALRELVEETGLTSLTPSVEPLLLFESAFPISLKIAPPRSHHLIVYHIGELDRMQMLGHHGKHHHHEHPIIIDQHRGQTPANQQQQQQQQSAKHTEDRSETAAGAAFIEDPTELERRLLQSLKLDLNEVDAAVWLLPDEVEAILSDESTDRQTSCGIAWNANTNRFERHTFQLSQLQMVPADRPPQEHSSIGTRAALFEFLQRLHESRKTRTTHPNAHVVTAHTRID